MNRHSVGVVFAIVATLILPCTARRACADDVVTFNLLQSRITSLPDSLKLPSDLVNNPDLKDLELYDVANAIEGFHGRLQKMMESKQRARATRRAVAALLVQIRHYTEVTAAFDNIMAISGGGTESQRKLRALSQRQLHAMEDWLRGIRINFNGLVPVPLGSTIHAEAFWKASDAIDVAPAVAVTGSKESGAVTATLLHTYFFGVRSSVVSAVSAGSSNDAVRPNAEKLLEAGGNLALGLEYPLAFYRSDATKLTGAPAASFVDLRLLAIPRMGFSHPNIGGVEGGSAFNTDVGAVAEFRFGSQGEAIVGKAAYRIAHVWGDETSEQSLGVDRDFGYQQVSATLVILGRIAIGWSKPFDAPPSIRKALSSSYTLSLAARQ